MEATIRQPSALLSGSALSIGFRLLALGVIDAIAIWFVAGMIDQGEWILAVFVAVTTLGVNAVFLIDGLYPLRWFAPGTVLLILMLLYPTAFTVYVAFTNYGQGNLLTKPQAEKVIGDRQYLPEDAPLYTWTAFRSEEDPNTYGLWLIPASEQAEEPIFALDGSITPADEMELGQFELDEDGIPAGLPGYERLPRGQTFAILDSVLAVTQFGEPGNVIGLNPGNPTAQAGVFRQRYTFNDDGTLLDNATGVLYEPIEGTYTPVEGPNMNEEGQVVDEENEPLPELSPGYYTTIGLDHFQRLIEDERIRGPFFEVFLWTFAHAFFTVLLTFSLGLFIALVLNAGIMPGRAVMRTALLVPYAFPAFITVLVWKGLLNQELGIINKMLESVLGVAPDWTTSPFWAKVAILLIQLWLGFPYMMLICTGALQSIPADMYEAARVDGANVWQQFRNLTLPMLLVAVGPLLIASFAFNFNNFTVVELYNEGKPAISPDTVAGATDILITYTYELAFGGTRGADYGFASTISLGIFVIVGAITMINFRMTRTWEEISENV